MFIIMLIFTYLFFSESKSRSNGLSNGQEVLALGVNQLCQQFIARE